MQSSNKRSHFFVCVSAALVLISRADASTLAVTSCADNNSAGTLRAQVTAAASGDTIDLNNLSCSPIVLSGEIAITQQDLSLDGHARATPATISGNHAGGVINHSGNGTLTISGLRIVDGNFPYPGPSGAHDVVCIHSAGSVAMSHSVVTGCTGVFPYIAGGGVYALGDVTLDSTDISNNAIGWSSSGGGGVSGGGVCTRGNLTATDSTISNNTANGYDGGFGGGATVSGNLTLVRSTISNNHGYFGSGIWVSGSASIVNSTISSNVSPNPNTAAVEIGGYKGAISATISNSTIANNNNIGLVFGGGTASDSIVLQSSIFAHNGDAHLEQDLRVAQGTPSGANNLAIRSNVTTSGVITLTIDPQLQPLGNNGGPTLTHALLAASPAIGAGNNVAGLSYDQRGVGYPRTTNGLADIGAIQFTDKIFADGFQ